MGKRIKLHPPRGKKVQFSPLIAAVNHLGIVLNCEFSYIMEGHWFHIMYMLGHRDFGTALALCSTEAMYIAVHKKTIDFPLILSPLPLVTIKPLLSGGIS